MTDRFVRRLYQFARAVDNIDIPVTLPRTVETLQDWDGEALPPDAAYEALPADLKDAEASNTLGSLARRLNLQAPGMRRDRHAEPDQRDSTLLRHGLVFSSERLRLGTTTPGPATPRP